MDYVDILCSYHFYGYQTYCCIKLMTYSIKDMKKEKKRNQVKSRFYYLFWGAATVSVFVGQLYVGMGYRLMSGSVFELIDSLERQDNRYVIK